MTMSRRSVRWATPSVVGAILLTTGGCGGDPAPDVAVPRLETTLSRVDESIAGENWERARQAVQRLISQTEAALEAGTLTQQQADRIQAAAARLLSELPAPPPQSPTPAAPAEPDAPPDHAEEPEEEGAEEGGGKGKGNGKSNGKSKGKGKGK